eukprot:5051464-Amphidinium_carterae.1
MQKVQLRHLDNCWRGEPSTSSTKDWPRMMDGNVSDHTHTHIAAQCKGTNTGWGKHQGVDPKSRESGRTSNA